MTIEDLKRIREQARQSVTLRSGEARARITIHMGTCGIAAGAREVMAAVLEKIDRLKLNDVVVTTSSCAGLCSREPMATVQISGQAPVKYVDLTPERMATIVERHILRGQIVSDFALASGCETTG
jgi:NADP-reducing hydrogenase subunit HndB